MRNIFQRNISIEELNDVELSTMSPSQLVSYVTTKYPDDPIGAVQYFTQAHLVGYVLGSQTELILEGLKGVKAN